MILPLVVTSIALPSLINKFFVSFFIFMLICVNYQNVFKKNELVKKLFMTLFFFPAIILCITNTPQEVIRFIPILLIIFLFPYKDIYFNKKLFYVLVLFLIIYMFFTQILLILSNAWILEFREIYYPFLYEENLFKYYEFSENLLHDIRGVRTLRSGGLFHSPNDLASFMFFNFVILTLLQQDQIFNKKHYWLIFNFTLIITLFSLYFTASRTYIFILFLFYGLTFALPIIKKMFNGMNNNRFYYIYLIAALFIGALAIILFSNLFLQAFTYSNSMWVKFFLLDQYLENASLFSLIFGGEHEYVFDADWGYLIGSFGIIGMINFFVLLTLIFSKIPLSRNIIICIIFIGFANSVFYGLLSAVQVLIILIISNNIIAVKGNKTD